MRAYVVRHGETDANVNGVIQGSLVDEPLNEVGRLQAQALARHLAAQRAQGLRFDGIWSSPLRRASETAAILARGVGHPPPAHLAGLREVSWGLYQGLKSDGPIRVEMRAILEAWRRGDAKARAPEGETPPAAWARAWADLEPLVRAHRDGTILLVGHGRINKILLSQLVHGDFLHMEEFPQRNGGYTILEGDETALRAPLRGAQAHMEGLRATEERAG